MDKKILIVDDDVSIQSLLGRVLKSQGFKVFAASDGSSGLELAQKQIPDIVLLDLTLPDMKGEDVLKRLKENGRTKLIPVIFVTGKGRQENIVQGLRVGADDYLAKPFSLEELKARIESVLRRCSLNLDANPLTRLPGSGVIERRIQTLLDKNKLFSVLYVDLNEFKAYNDYYGAHRGDSVIRATAEVLKEVCKEEDSLVGHIGGDDFIVVTERQDIEEMSQNILNRFDAIRGDFYDEADRKVGYIMVSDRRGIKRAFSPVSIAIGIVTNRIRPLKSMMEISAIGAEVKSVAKKLEGSAYFVDRRRDAYRDAQKQEMEEVPYVQ